MIRIDRDTRDVTEHLNPEHWVSSVWHGDATRPCEGCADCQPEPSRRDEPHWRCHGRRRVKDARYGVSVCADEDELIGYLAHTGADLDGCVLVELEGDPSPDEPHDEYFGEHLILPTWIVSVRPADEGFIAAVRSAQSLGVA